HIVTGAPPPAGDRNSFKTQPTLGRVVELADEHRETMEARGQKTAEGPSHVEFLSGALLDSAEVWFPPSGARRRLRGKQARPLLDGDAADALAAALTGTPTPPPEGHARVLAEPIVGHDVGAVADASKETLIGEAVDALWFRRGRALRVEQIAEFEVADWAARRLAELSRLLEASLPAAALGDGSLAFGDGPVPNGGGAADVRAGAAEAAPMAAKLDDSGGDDTRTLWVERGDQGDRFKEFRKAVSESVSYVWGHQRLEGGLTRLRTCKMMRRTSGSPRAWLEKFLRGKNFAPTDRVARELRPLVEALEEAGCIDQVYLGGLACLEVIARRLGAIVDACKRGGAPSVANAKYLFAAGRRGRAASAGAK
ncbi:unnamed protein product, partial [Prorocentrum cordatum]